MRNSRNREIFPITIRELKVASVEDITPGMRRITLTGEQLRAHRAFGVDAPPLFSNGFDDDIRIIFPDPATGQRPHPITQEDATVLWQDEVKDLFRTYTVRSFDTSRGQLIVDFARHGHGLAENWSARAQPGDALYIAGPKSSAELPIHAPWLLLMGDETALPAIARCVESLPAGYKAVAIVEVATRADVQQLEHQAEVELHWQVRDEGGDFVKRVADLYGGSPVWASDPARMPYVWAAGEAGRLKTIRRWVREIGVPRENVEITGYWRASGGDGGVGTGGAGEGPQPPTVGSAHRNVVAALHELTDMGPGILVRQAVGLGLFGFIDKGVDRVDQLATATCSQEQHLLRFARYLEAVGLVTLSDGEPTDTGEKLPLRIAVTQLGSELANPDSPVQDWIAGPTAAKSAALAQLGRALQEPAELSDAATFRWDSIVQAKPQLAVEEHEQAVTRAQWSAPALAKILSEKLAGHQGAGVLCCAVGGPAAAVHADELLRRLPESTAVVLGSFAEEEDTARLSVVTGTADRTEPGAGAEEVMLRDIAPDRRDRACYNPLFAPTSVAADARRSNFHQVAGCHGERIHVVVLVDPWRRWPVAELLQLVADVLDSGAQLFMMTSVLQARGAEDHDYEEDLLRLVLYGTQVPTVEEIVHQLATVGAEVRSQQSVGWSAKLFEVVR